MPSMVLFLVRGPHRIRSKGCNAAQGCLFSRPVPAHAVPFLIAKLMARRTVHKARRQAPQRPIKVPSSIVDNVCRAPSTPVKNW